MNYGKDPKASLEMAKQFKRFATKDHGVNSLYFDKITQAMTPTNMTPYIIEERQLNISQLDVFSRLMMDRIIFWVPESTTKSPISCKRNCCF